MRNLAFLALSLAAFTQTIYAQSCDISAKKDDQPFPDIEAEGAGSYQMAVEYTVPGSTQTDYYTEYYDIIERRGRVESHQQGESKSYIYRTASWEAWEVTDKSCSLKNITETQEMEKDDMSDWMYIPPDDKFELRTYGPSAMFKNGLDAWKNKNDKNKMAFMGKFIDKVRGLDAEFWRRCHSDGSYVDYFFTVAGDESPFGLDSLKHVPLRVSFYGKREGKAKEMSDQRYEIISYQPFISLGVEPFDLPKGLGCKRGYVEDAPEVPDFSGKNLMFYAEAIYRKIKYTGEDAQYWSYYSTLMFALDIQSQHVAYYYTPWNSTKPESEGEPTADAPEILIYDMKQGYQYKTTLDTGECQIIRDSRFVPEYKLPNDAGGVPLADPSILFPNNELTYITKGTTRGLKVNLFEENVEGYLLDKNNEDFKIPHALITHAYLQDNEREQNSVSVKNALAQVRLRFSGREDGVIEILTFNFYGFTTELQNSRNIFNIARCFKNDNDYLWATIGFSADPKVLANIQDDVPSIQDNILNMMKLETELNAVRIPIILVDVNDDGIYVTMLILNKPPVQLDYLDPIEGKTITDTAEKEGVSTAEACANECLESEDNCWGFSICGAICSFGTEKGGKVGDKKDCKLYNRFNNGSFIPTKENMAENIRREVKEKGVKLMLPGKDGEEVQIDANYFEVNSPEEDDELFERMGNTLNPRMKVVKAGYKLKATAGTPVKNMGRLRYDQCQKICLDYKICESVSYCLKGNECILSKSYGEDIKDEELEQDNMCTVITRKYADNFDRSPGNVLALTAEEELDLDTAEKCARACMQQDKYVCKSFDHCPADEKRNCKLHTVHFPNAQSREKVQTRETNCGHYYRKYSTEFKRNPEKRMVGSKVTPITNVTLEECAVLCKEFGKGTCYGFDFCQDKSILSTSCTILDSDPGQMKSSYSPVCANFLRGEAQFAQRPYSNAYAGGIGFLCFLVGGVLGAAIIFGIAYCKVNKR